MSDAQAPDGLGPRGSALWEAVVEAFEFFADEAEVLAEACRTVDLLDALESELRERGPVDAEGKVSPIVGALRANRAELRHALASLGIPHADAPPMRSGNQTRAAKAARARWKPQVVEGGE